MNLADSPEDIDPSAAIYVLDMEVSRADELEPVPGITTVFTTASPRTLPSIFNQPSIDYSSELVIIDAPWLGYSAAYSGPVFVNAGIDGTTGGMAGTRWNGKTIGGVLIFSNGTNRVFTRASLAITVANVSTQLVSADTFAGFAGRTYAGAITPVGGTYQGLGMAWSSSSGVISDFTGANSGAELLIQDTRDADKIIAILSLGFDVMGILCRHSLWAAYRTGGATRPADFRPRFQAVGCVSRDTAQLTPGGITFLSDEGVINYDVNNVDMISREINTSLLPLDTTQLSTYKAVYSANRQRYYLQTPTATWIYEFPIKFPYPKPSIPGRWIKRSAIVSNMLVYSNQGSNPFGSAETVGFVNAAGTVFGKEDSTVLANFEGTAFQPVWRTPSALKAPITDQTTTVGFEIEYTSSAASTINVVSADSAGNFSTGSNVIILPSTVGVLTRVRNSYILTGMNTGIQITITSGAPKINRITQFVRPTGPVLKQI